MKILLFKYYNYILCYCNTKEQHRWNTKFFGVHTDTLYSLEFTHSIFLLTLQGYLTLCLFVFSQLISLLLLVLFPNEQVCLCLERILNMHVNTQEILAYIFYYISFFYRTSITIRFKSNTLCKLLKSLITNLLLMAFLLHVHVTTFININIVVSSKVVTCHEIFFPT